MVRKIDFADDLLPLLEAEAARLKTTLSGMVNMLLAGPVPAPYRPLSGPSPAPAQAGSGPGETFKEGGEGDTESPNTPPSQKAGRAPRTSRVSSPPPETPPGLLEPVNLWLAYKAERGEGYKPRGAEQLIRKLAAMGPQRAREAIEHSMAQNYAGVFEPQNGHARASPQRAAGASDEHMAAICAVGGEEWIAPDYFAKESA